MYLHTSNVNEGWVKLQDAFNIIILLDDNHDGGDIAYGWRLVYLQTVFSYGEVECTKNRMRKQDKNNHNDPTQ